VILDNCISYIFHKLSKEFNRESLPKFNIGERYSRIEILDNADDCDIVLYVYINCIITKIDTHSVTFSSEEHWLKEADEEIELEEKNCTGFFGFDEKYKIFK